MRAINLIDRRFGRLLVVSLIGKNTWGNRRYECLCDCGKKTIVASGKLLGKRVKSCGCYKRDLGIAQLQKHGITTGGKPRTFIIWNGMKSRCLNPKATSYKSYGGRGIGICKEWMSFENFHKWAINNGYQEKLTIDRKDNDKGYSPANCIWSTEHANKIRQRHAILIEIDGVINSITGWSEILRISRPRLRNYYNHLGKEMTALGLRTFMNSGDYRIFHLNNSEA